ncbi:hypothetical protein [Catenuloplanes japonicus]|uniref:hypothetical protein n=1 Tax=Catenuloplanes japonicus TaxID=33876 RepID=UPI000526BE2A|nr:hypothetical protein [Catenuloplanes japonicus]
MARSLAALIAAGVALGALTAGCGSGDSGSGEPTPALTAAEQETLRQASERLIAQCMHAHGFAYAEQPPPVEDRQFRYVLDDVGYAREHGYGALTGRRDETAHDVNDGNLAALSPARRKAWQYRLMGAGNQLTVDLPDAGRLSAPDNGCRAESHRTLFGDLQGWYRARRIVDHVDNYVAGQVTRAPEYVTALSEWGACVRAHGYAASTPQELRALVTTELPGPPAAPEIHAAETEAGCAVTTGFTGTVGALDQRYRPDAERRFTTEINTLHRYERTALPTAGQILAES